MNLVGRHDHPELFTPFNQGRNESCVLVTILYGMSLVQNPPIRDNSEMPSINYAYYKSRKNEKDRCCKGDHCDYACGSVISLGLKIAEGGVVPRSSWPEEYPDSKEYIKRFKKDLTMGSKYLHYLNGYDVLDVNPQSVVESLNQGYPVVANIRVFDQQHDFFTHVKGEGTSVYSPVYSLPKATGQPRELGHCVLIIGYSKENQSFRARNSFGTGWGYRGDFNIPFDQFEPWQVYKAISITGSTIK